MIRTCSVDSAKKLWDLGIKDDAIFYWYFSGYDWWVDNDDDKWFDCIERYPAYTSEELLLFFITAPGKNCLTSLKNGEKVVAEYCEWTPAGIKLLMKEEGANEADARAKLLIRLKESV